jgi:hypothetical protein
MAVYLTNGFEGGTSGTTISTSNSGGNSGNAFDAVSIGASATLQFSSAQAAHGSLSMALTEPATAAATYVEWSASLTGSSIATVYFRAYVYLPANPPNNLRFIQAYSSGTLCGSVTSNTNGKIVLSNSANTIEQTFTTAVSTAAWFRVEGSLTGASGTGGAISCSLYNSPDSTTATESHSVSGFNTTGAVTAILFGEPVAETNSYTFYMDNLGASDTGLLGPAEYTGTGTAALNLAASAAGGRRQRGGGSGSLIVPVLAAADLI